MTNQPVLLLTLIVFLPALGALVLAFLPKERPDVMRYFSLAVTIVVFLLTVTLTASGFAIGQGAMQNMFSIPWISSFHIFYFMGTDGISLALVLLTSFLSMLAMGASWPIVKSVRAYCILFLLLETGMLGVFLSLDFFLFYVFWEVMLLPMYFLIGVWGGPRREYAAIKFFLYTLLGSVLMLIAILMLYFNSDLRLLSKTQLSDAGVITAVGDTPAEREVSLDHAAAEIRDMKFPQYTYNILALTRMGQLKQSPFSGTGV